MTGAIEALTALFMTETTLGSLKGLRRFLLLNEPLLLATTLCYRQVTHSLSLFFD